MTFWDMGKADDLARECARVDAIFAELDLLIASKPRRGSAMIERIARAFGPALAAAATTRSASQ